MIARKYRLREYEISRVFKKGRPFFWTYWTVNAFEARWTHHRMAVSISRKHDKRAVQRNRYRRGVYDALLPSLKFSVSSLKPTASETATQNSSAVANKTQNIFHCVFTLKKWLRATEKKIPQEWIDDAVKIFAKWTGIAQNKNIS